MEVPSSRPNAIRSPMGAPLAVMLCRCQSRVEATDALEQKAKEYNYTTTYSEQVKAARQTVDIGLKVLFSGRIAKSWHGVASTDVASIRSSLVACQRAMSQHNFVPGRMLTTVLTNAFRTGLRGHVMS